ncbi:carbamoyl-phosphate synthase large chain [Striga asiatica]|uniref:Carbamoyl-phosphate synthase large chain n=1 Tax=Striga asiatica TaxID=4170 RepID=A0A5A7PS10_STRAF|nr:carbamoyl-phosphate synthase large chain [Striga asiatica]
MEIRSNSSVTLTQARTWKLSFTVMSLYTIWARVVLPIPPIPTIGITETSSWQTSLPSNIPYTWDSFTRDVLGCLFSAVIGFLYSGHEAVIGDKGAWHVARASGDESADSAPSFAVLGLFLRVLDQGPGRDLFQKVIQISRRDSSHSFTDFSVSCFSSASSRTAWMLDRLWLSFLKWLLTFSRRARAMVLGLMEESPKRPLHIKRKNKKRNSIRDIAIPCFPKLTK